MRRPVLAVGLLTAVLAAPGAAVAYLTNSGPASGTLTAAADSLPAGAQPATSVQGRNVQLRWAPSRFGDGTAATGYTVAGSHASAAPVSKLCTGSVSAADGLADGCGFDGLASGSWQFTVTPHYAGWSGGASVATAVPVPFPGLSVSPSTLPEGGQTTVRTTGFVGAQKVEVRWASASGQVLGQGVTAADGTSAIPVTVPIGTANGTYQLFAVGSLGDQVSVPVKVANKARNVAPVAADDSGFGVGVVELDALANDTDENGDPLVVTAVGKARNGGTTILSDRRTVRYVAQNSYPGEDSFTYDVSDGRGGTARATVRVSVGGLGVSGTFVVPTNATISLGGDGSGLATAASPLALRVTSPVSGPFKMVVIGPSTSRAGGWVVGGQNLRASGPVGAATPTSPFKLAFRVEAPAAGKGKNATVPASTEVFLDGVAVPACGNRSNGTAIPDPCWSQNEYNAFTNDYVVVVWSTRLG